jgi:sec-independent protein translocase protein TatA
MHTIGPTEIIIVLLIIVLLFGVGRIGKIGGELGKGIREFRSAVKEDEKPADAPKKDETTTPAA